MDEAGAAAGRRLGAAVTADGVSVRATAGGSRIRPAAADIVVRDVASGARLLTLRDEGGAAAPRTRLAPDGARLIAASGARVRLWSLPGEGATAERAADLDVTALSVEPDRDVVVLGFRGGQLRLGAGPDVARVAAAPSGVDYFGHRGAVSALAVDAGRNRRHRRRRRDRARLGPRER